MGRAQSSFKQHSGLAYCSPQEQEKALSPWVLFRWSKCSLQFRGAVGLESEVEAIGNVV